MLNLKSLPKLVSALKEMVYFASGNEDRQAIPACDKLLEDILEKGVHAVAIEIASGDEVYPLNGEGLLMSRYEVNPGEYKVIVRGSQYGLYPINGPRFNQILVKHGLQEEQDSSRIKVSSNLSPIIGRGSISY